jgi:hypothetical protein
MVRTMDGLGFGNCGNERECEAECPKQISIAHIARLNREFYKAELSSLPARTKLIPLRDKAGLGSVHR